MFLRAWVADQVGDDAEGRQGDDVDLGMAEEPEQVLEQDRAAAAIFQLRAHLDEGRHEEAGSQQPVEQHHDGATNSAGKASSAMTVAVKMPHTVRGRRISVMPRVRPCSTVTT